MNKELEEAWRRIKLTVDLSDSDSDVTEPEDLLIVEAALENYEYQTKVFEKLTEPKLPILTKEEMEQLKKSSDYIAKYNGTYVDENTFKKLKALEIIIKYEIDIRTLEESESLEDYNEGVYPIGATIDTQEEYDLLKEVLYDFL